MSIGADLNPTAEQDLMKDLYALVDEQAKDEGLWSTPLDRAIPIAEAHLQQELRRLHALIESRRDEDRRKAPPDPDPVPVVRANLPLGELERRVLQGKANV